MRPRRAVGARVAQGYASSVRVWVPNGSLYGCLCSLARDFSKKKSVCLSVCLCVYTMTPQLTTNSSGCCRCVCVCKREIYICIYIHICCCRASYSEHPGRKIRPTRPPFTTKEMKKHMASPGARAACRLCLYTCSDTVMPSTDVHAR